MAAAVYTVADNRPHMVLVDPPYQEVPEVPVDQVVLVQEDTEDQVPAVAALAVAVPDEAVPDVVVPDEAVPAVAVPAVAVVPVEIQAPADQAVVAAQVAADQDAEPDTDQDEAGNVPVAVEQPEVQAEADQAVLEAQAAAVRELQAAVPADTEVVAFQEDNPVEVPVEEWPVEEDPAEVESLAAEQVQAEMIPEVHQEEQAPVPSMQEVRMMEEKSELIVPEQNMLNSRSEQEQQDVEEKVERQRKLNHCHTELFPCFHLPSSQFACQERLKWRKTWPPAKLG